MVTVRARSRTLPGDVSWAQGAQGVVAVKAQRRRAGPLIDFATSALIAKLRLRSYACWMRSAAFRQRACSARVHAIVSDLRLAQQAVSPGATRASSRAYLLSQSFPPGLSVSTRFLLSPVMQRLSAVVSRALQPPTLHSKYERWSKLVRGTFQCSTCQGQLEGTAGLKLSNQFQTFLRLVLMVR